MIVAGDPGQPRGPYSDSASIIRSRVLEEYGVREVSLAGHRGGHPAVGSDVLWEALADKAEALQQLGLSGSIVTQLEFDAEVVLGWLVALRARGIRVPVHVGVPGPAAHHAMDQPVRSSGEDRPRSLKFVSLDED